MKIEIKHNPTSAFLDNKKLDEYEKIGRINIFGNDSVFFGIVIDTNNKKDFSVIIEGNDIVNIICPVCGSKLFRCSYIRELLEPHDFFCSNDDFRIQFFYPLDFQSSVNTK